MHEEKLLMDLFINVKTVPHYVSYAFLASLILIVTAFMVNRSLKLVPTGLQNFMEAIAEGVLNLCEENIGHHWAKHFLSSYRHGCPVCCCLQFHGSYSGVLFSDQQYQ